MVDLDITKKARPTNPLGEAVISFNGIFIQKNFIENFSVRGCVLLKTS